MDVSILEAEHSCGTVGSVSDNNSPHELTYVLKTICGVEQREASGVLGYETATAGSLDVCVYTLQNKHSNFKQFVPKTGLRY